MTISAPRVWITRTQPGADATALRVRALGWQPVVEPVLAVHPITAAMDKAPDPTSLSALALTSPNTVATLKSQLSAYRHLPVFAVGDATAETARNAGLKDVRSAKGDIHALAALIGAQLPKGAVFAPGAKEPAGDLPALLPNHQVIRLAVYETVACTVALPDNLAAILVHSPRAARIVAPQLAASNSRPPRLVAISAAAAEPLRDIFAAEIHISDTPDEEALLRTLGNSVSPV